MDSYPVMQVMNLGRLFHTVRYLKPAQVGFRVYYILQNKMRKVIGDRRPLSIAKAGQAIDFEPWIDKPLSLHGDNHFRFLNLERVFPGWGFDTESALWMYNLNYMDFLLQEDMNYDRGAFWIDRFIIEAKLGTVSFDAYPIALRGINWIKFITKYRNCVPQKKIVVWESSLFAQYTILSSSIEYHLLGNHLLEDAFSLLWGGIYFNDERFLLKSERILYRELDEQILPDGAHFELSPMYHAILLDRLLDCVNVAKGRKIACYLEKKASIMLGWLEEICYSNGDFPLFNDSAKQIAPVPIQLFDYAQRLGIKWEKSILNESGYRKIKTKKYELILDVGAIGPDYIPGHAHADTFNYELRCNGVPYVIDSGISTYDKNAKRQYERGTEAHNTVSIRNQNSSCVWGGFRVAKRARILSCDVVGNDISASHDGYLSLGKIHQRTFSSGNDFVTVTDFLTGYEDIIGISRIHLHPGVSILSFDISIVRTTMGDIHIEGAKKIQCVPCQVAEEYNRLIDAICIEMQFINKLVYTFDLI